MRSDLAAREGPHGSSLYSLSLSRSRNPAQTDKHDPWDSSFLLVGGNSIHEAKIFSVSSVFSLCSLHAAHGTEGEVAKKAPGTLWASAMYRVRRRSSLMGGQFSALKGGGSSSAGGGGGGAGSPKAAAAAHSGKPGEHSPAVPRTKPAHHLLHTPMALQEGGFPVPKGKHAAAPLVGTVTGFPKALYSVHWAPGEQGFGATCGGEAYVMDLMLPGGGGEWAARGGEGGTLELKPAAAAALAPGGGH